MDRSTITLSQTIRTMIAVSAVLVSFFTATHIVQRGFATPAIASSATEITGFVKKSNGAGLVLFVSLQRP